MAKKKSGFANYRSIGLVCGVAAAFAASGYYVGKNGAPPVSPRIAGAIEKAGAETARTEARAEQAGAAFLTKLTSAAAEIKSAATKPPAPKAGRTKAANKAVAAKAAAPIPPASIPGAPKPEPKKIEIAKAEEPKADAPKAEISASDITNTTPPTGAPLSASLLNKGIPTSEDSRIRLSVNFENRTGKPIRAFEGVLKFTDGQDHGLFSSKISVSALISGGGKLQWDERVDPEKLDANGKKIVDADKENLRAVFVPRKVFFVDGSVQKFGG